MATGLSTRHVPPRNGLLPVLILTLVGLLVGCGASTSHPSAPTPIPTKELKGTITEFPIPTSKSAPAEITTGPDGNLWFVEGGSNKIGRITTSGAITEFLVPTAHIPIGIPIGGFIRGPGGITTGPDGNLWFTELDVNNNKIGRITPSGMITEFPLPAFNNGVWGPWGITTGPDGNLWFTESESNKIGRIT